MAEATSCRGPCVGPSTLEGSLWITVQPEKKNPGRRWWKSGEVSHLSSVSFPGNLHSRGRWRGKSKCKFPESEGAPRCDSLFSQLQLRRVRTLSRALKHTWPDSFSKPITRAKKEGKLEVKQLNAVCGPCGGSGLNKPITKDLLGAIGDIWEEFILLSVINDINLWKNVFIFRDGYMSI